MWWNWFNKKKNQKQKNKNKNYLTLCFLDLKNYLIKTEDGYDQNPT